MIRKVDADEFKIDQDLVTQTGTSLRYHYFSICATRDLFFSKTSCLHWYAEATTIEDRAAEMEVSLVLLYSINNMLWNLRDNNTKAIELLADFTHTVNNSVAGPVLKGGRRHMEAKSPIPGVLFLMCYCTTNLGDRKASDESALRLCEGIEFVDLMMLVSPAICQTIVQIMSSWLITRMRDPNSLLLLRDVHLAGLAREIEYGWKSSSEI